MMSFRVETTPHQYTEYEIFSATRLKNLGRNFLSLINPNYEGDSIESQKPAGDPVKTDSDNTKPTDENPPNENESEKITTNENGATGTENEKPTNENEKSTEEKEKPMAENEIPVDGAAANVTQKEPIDRHIIQQPSDLCRPRREQCPYYIVSPDVITQIEENFIPHQTTLPYIPPADNRNVDTGDSLASSIDDWQSSKQAKSNTRNLLSQIVTIIQCRSTQSSILSSSVSQRTKHVIRLFINSQKQQQQQMDTFLDMVNEAFLLEPNTIKTLWDAKCERITDPVDLLVRGRLYFASRDTQISIDELNISDDDLASINRLEVIRQQFSQSEVNLVERPTNHEQASVPSRKSTPFDIDERRSATVKAQAIAYNDPQTFPDVFLNHYTVGDVVGDGRFSAVLECRDKATGIQLALKIIDKERCKGYEYLTENELSILRRIKHPNIIKLVEEFQTDQKYFLVFEYISNGDLLKALTTMNKYSEHDVALMLSQIAAALKYLHSLSIVHRDVKLENILMAHYPDQTVTLKLADFGLALCLTDETRNSEAQGNSFCGTPMYTAPEVIKSRDYRIENDMWSLGVIAYTLLTGTTPFDGETDDDILVNVMEKTIDFSVLPKVSAECRDALISMLERNPNKRISANDLLQHPWIKFESKTPIEPVKEGTSPRRKKAAVKKQPMLTFSSADYSNPMHASALGGLLNDMNEY